MICLNCGKEYEGNFCPFCGLNNAEKERMFEKYKPVLYDQSEEVIAVLADNTENNLESTKPIEKNVVVLSDKRIYLKGDCFVQHKNGISSRIEEKCVSLSDVTGTGFVQSKPTWMKIWAIIFSILAVIMLFVMMGISADRSASPEDLGLPAALCGIFIILGIFFAVLFQTDTFTAFEISYAGGSVAFDTQGIDKENSNKFLKILNLQKDKVKSESPSAPAQQRNTLSTLQTPDVPQLLLRYKELMEKGIISKEEFEEKKKDLLELYILP